MHNVAFRRIDIETKNIVVHVCTHVQMLSYMLLSRGTLIRSGNGSENISLHGYIFTMIEENSVGFEANYDPYPVFGAFKMQHLEHIK